MDFSACRLSVPAAECDSPVCLAFASPTPSDLNLILAIHVDQNKLPGSTLSSDSISLPRYAGTDVAIRLWCVRKVHRKNRKKIRNDGELHLCGSVKKRVNVKRITRLHGIFPPTAIPIGAALSPCMMELQSVPFRE